MAPSSYGAGYGFVPDDSLRSFDATTGTMLASAPLPFYVGAMTGDSDGKYLFLVGYGDCGPRLAIHDARTLALLGNVSVPDSLPWLNGSTCYFPGFLAQIISDRSLGKVWIVGLGDPAPSWEFDILP